MIPSSIKNCINKWHGFRFTLGNINPTYISLMKLSYDLLFLTVIPLPKYSLLLTSKTYPFQKLFSLAKIVIGEIDWSVKLFAALFYVWGHLRSEVMGEGEKMLHDAIYLLSQCISYRKCIKKTCKWQVFWCAWNVVNFWCNSKKGQRIRQRISIIPRIKRSNHFISSSRRNFDPLVPAK